MPSIDSADVSILVHNNTDYQFTFAALLSFVSSNVAIGAAITFGTALPQNNTGKNGDLFINTATGSFAQKTSGSWAIVYTPSSSDNQADGTILYGLGVPNNSTGKNGDTYIHTGTGVFYKKSTGAWGQTFSMQNGPAGAKGDKGDHGDTGAAGKTILNGAADPSNQDTGTDGDFYVNINTWYLFGPKASGAWPDGVSIVQSSDNIKTVISGLMDSLTIDWQVNENGALKHGDFPTYQEINKDDNGKWTVNATPNIEETRNDAGDVLLSIILTPSVPGQTNFIII